jgi:hypothetical protein
MKKRKIDSLMISNLTRMEFGSYIEKFGDNGWLDIENKILIDMREMNEFSVSKLDTFFGINSSDYLFIIVDLNDMKS